MERGVRLYDVNTSDWGVIPGLLYRDRAPADFGTKQTVNLAPTVGPLGCDLRCFAHHFAHYNEKAVLAGGFSFS
jgi:hypothetical protein